MGLTRLQSPKLSLVNNQRVFKVSDLVVPEPGILHQAFCVRQIDDHGFGLFGDDQKLLIAQSIEGNDYRVKRELRKYSRDTRSILLVESSHLTKFFLSHW